MGFDLYEHNPEQIFHGQMKVYGNGNIHLSHSKPLYGMKTTTQGNFYIPNGAINPNVSNFFRIEKLFNNSRIVGDQTGGLSPYSSIRYPDGTVDIPDLSFVSSKMGLHNESDPKWDYMADVYPDRKIDIQDVARVSANFGKIGTYITDLSGVTVTFSTGDEWGPDCGRFVFIPGWATSFTVKRNGTTIGAMIVFWKIEP